MDGDGYAIAEEYLSLFDFFLRNQNPRLILVQHHHYDERQSRGSRRYAGLRRGEEVDIPVQYRLRSDRRSHLNVLDIEPGFCIEPFFLGDIEWKSGNRCGWIADANFLHGFDRMRRDRKKWPNKNQQRCDQNCEHRSRLRDNSVVRSAVVPQNLFLVLCSDG